MDKEEQKRCAKLLDIDPSYIKDEETTEKMLLQLEQDLVRDVNNLKRETKALKSFTEYDERIKLVFILNESSEPLTIGTLSKILKLDSKNAKEHLEHLENNYLVKSSSNKELYQLTMLGQIIAKDYFKKINSKNNH